MSEAHIWMLIAGACAAAAIGAAIYGDRQARAAREAQASLRTTRGMHAIELSQRNEQLDAICKSALDAQHQRLTEHFDQILAERVNDAALRAAAAEMKVAQTEQHLRNARDEASRNTFAAKAFEAAARGWQQYAAALEQRMTVPEPNAFPIGGPAPSTERAP